MHNNNNNNNNNLIDKYNYYSKTAYEIARESKKISRNIVLLT